MSGKLCLKKLAEVQIQRHQCVIIEGIRDLELNPIEIQSQPSASKIGLKMNPGPRLVFASLHS
jgi:hypothetical protein